jgi:hypothetical protein
MGGYGVALCELRFQVAGGYGGVAACCLACGLLAACALGSLILRFAMFAQNNCNKPDPDQNHNRPAYEKVYLGFLLVSHNS